MFQKFLTLLTFSNCSLLPKHNIECASIIIVLRILIDKQIYTCCKEKYKITCRIKMIHLLLETYIHENATLQNRNELLADKTENSYEVLRNVTIKYFI